MAKHLIVETSYGETMLKNGIVDGVLECYIGCNYDEYVGDIEGTLYDEEDVLVSRFEQLF